MADETVVREPLLEARVVEGRRLVELLDADGIEIVAALWLFIPSADEWRLMLSTPRVEVDGPQATYKRIRALLDRESEQLQNLNLSNISLLSPADSLIQRLRSALKTGPGIHSIRFTRNLIDDLFIEDALIYRVA